MSFLRCWYLWITGTAYRGTRLASPRKPLQKFNMADFVATSQAFVVKAVIICVYWCPYIVRHRAPLRVLLTHAYGNQA